MQKSLAKNSIYNINVKNPDGKNNTVESFKVNGKEIEEKKIKIDDGVYNIEIYM